MKILEEREVECTGNASVHVTAELEKDVVFGKDLRVWRWSHICKGAKIGDNVMIGEHVHVGPNVVIGNNVRIQNGAQLFEGVVLEDNVFIGPEVCFTNIKRPKIEYPNKKYLQTVVKKNASIGANATILCGVTIGENAMVGAGCVVTTDIPSNITVVGNPARVLNKTRNIKLNYEKFNND